MKPQLDYTLYLVTDQKLMSTPTLEEAVEAACEGGVTLVQIREKNASDDAFLDVARRCKAITDSYGVGLIVNDNPQVAAAVGAAGVHVGQDDTPVPEVRRVVGPHAVIGVSAHSVEEALRAKEEGARYIPICAKTEEDIADYSPEEKKAFLAEMGIEASGLDNLITASYDLLGLISFLTDGKKECRAWTIRKGTKAPQAAGKIHSDFERGFIRASVIGYNDLEANNFDYAAVKAKGLQRTEGKEYVVHDGDVIEFLFNV